MIINDVIKVKNFCVDDNCSRCGECCGDCLPVSAKEIEIIKDYVKKHKIKPYTCNVVNPQLDLSCPFYDMNTKKCNIYEVRPSICRSFQCNLSYEEISKNKIKHHVDPKYRIISFREVIYGDKSIYLKMAEILD